MTTGVFTAEQLRAAAPPGAEEAGQLVILQDLADLPAVLKALGL